MAQQWLWEQLLLIPLRSAWVLIPSATTAILERLNSCTDMLINQSFKIRYCHNLYLILDQTKLNVKKICIDNFLVISQVIQPPRKKSIWLKVLELWRAQFKFFFFFVIRNTFFYYLNSYSACVWLGFWQVSIYLRKEFLTLSEQLSAVFQEVSVNTNLLLLSLFSYIKV